MLVFQCGRLELLLRWERERERESIPYHLNICCCLISPSQSCTPWLVIKLFPRMLQDAWSAELLRRWWQREVKWLSHGITVHLVVAPERKREVKCDCRSHYIKALTIMGPVSVMCYLWTSHIFYNNKTVLMWHYETVHFLLYCVLSLKWQRSFSGLSLSTKFSMKPIYGA